MQEYGSRLNREYTVQTHVIIPILNLALNT